MRSIRWTLSEVLDFADDIVIIANRYVDIQDKTDNGLYVNIEKKTKVLRINARTTQPA